MQATLIHRAMQAPHAARPPRLPEARSLAATRLTRCLRWAATGVVALLLAACGGGGSAVTHTVSVTVTGMRHSYNGMTLQNNGGDKLRVYGDGTRPFATALASGVAYSVTVLSQPAGPDQACTVSNGSGTVASAAVSSARVVCGYHRVSVTVSGLRPSARGLTLRNNGIDGMQPFNGKFTFYTPLADGSPYDVTVDAQPTGPHQTCVVNAGSGTVAGSDVNVAVDCPYPTAYDVGGTVSGLTGTSLQLRYNADDLSFPLSLALNTNGPFAFDAANTSAVTGSQYSVTIAAQPTNPDQTCVVGAGNGTVAAADVANVDIHCGPVVVPSTCVPPSSAGTRHGSVTSAQTWAEAGGPHIVPFDIGISAPLMIGPCTVVRIVKGGTVTVSPGGSLIAAGVPGRPVSFEPQVPGMAWSSIRNLGGTLSLTHARVNGGGDPLNVNPAWRSMWRADTPMPSRPIGMRWRWPGRGRTGRPN